MSRSLVLVCLALAVGCSSASVDRQESPGAGGGASAAPSATEAGASLDDACSFSGVATWDFDPAMAVVLCPPSRTDCLLCAQCTDGHGTATVDYVITSYASTCACPVAADAPSGNCARDGGH